MHRLATALLAVVVMLASASFTLPSTRKGIQCPTAPIQKVVVNEVEKLSDGETAMVQVERTPQPGDPGFVQCHCAEKKAAKQIQAVASDLKEIPAILSEAPQNLSSPSVQVRVSIVGPSLVAICSTSEPQVRPPATA